VVDGVGDELQGQLHKPLVSPRKRRLSMPLSVRRCPDNPDVLTNGETQRQLVSVVSGLPMVKECSRHGPVYKSYVWDSEKAAYEYGDLPEETIRNRDLLREVMEGHGFVALETEWWQS
jgi:D-ala-D-ala dipeptidase